MNKDKILLSIIIPTYAQRHSLTECLESICSTAFPKNQFEVIVVDDANDHEINDLLKAFSSRIHLHIIHQKILALLQLATPVAQ